MRGRPGASHPRGDLVPLPEDLLVNEARLSVRVEQGGLRDENSLGVEMRGLQKVARVGILVGMGLDEEAVDPELQVCKGKMEKELVIVANPDGLVEHMGK